MRITDLFARFFKWFLPSPFTLAVCLTILVYVIALLFGNSQNTDQPYALELLNFWDGEMWNVQLLGFLVQMMLMLVLGHTLALSKPFSKLADKATRLCTTPANSAFIVTMATILVSLFNWGLGLIFGAILARKVGERFARLGKPLNYALIGAAGYVGLMVWHGGISGSSLIKISQEGSVKQMMSGSGLSAEQIAALPDSIGFDQTVFGTMNVVVTCTLLVVLPLMMYLIATKNPGTEIPVIEFEPVPEKDENITGAERLDASRLFAFLIGGILVSYAVYKAFLAQKSEFSLNFIDPNYINLVLLGLCFIAHRSIRNFLFSAEDAVKGASGILLQFPLYFGILGIIKHSGLMHEIAEYTVQLASPASYPAFNFFSAGAVNIFVPSGGGQWAIQGPVIVESAANMGASLDKNIMALAYGDQITNMLQPFWALPLLAITRLKAIQILPYTLILMIAGTIIFLSALLLF